MSSYRSTSPALIGAVVFLVAIELLGDVYSAVHPGSFITTFVAAVYFVLHIGLSIRFYMDGYGYHRALVQAVPTHAQVAGGADRNVIVGARRRAGQTLLVIGIGNTLVMLG